MNNEFLDDFFDKIKDLKFTFNINRDIRKHIETCYNSIDENTNIWFTKDPKKMICTIENCMCVCHHSDFLDYNIWSKEYLMPVTFTEETSQTWNDVILKSHEFTLTNQEEIRTDRHKICFEEHCIMPEFHNTFHLSKILYQDKFGFKWRVLWFENKWGGYICDESGFHKGYSDLITKNVFLRNWVLENIIFENHHKCIKYEYCFICYKPANGVCYTGNHYLKTICVNNYCKIK